MKKFLSAFILLFCFSVPLSAQPTPVPQVNARDLADADGQFVDVNGSEIYYIERGQSDDPVVLLLHGFGGSTFTWRDNMDAMVEAGFRVIAFDRPPYGLSDKAADQDFSVPGYVQLTAALMDVLAVERAVLVGHSAGGTVIAQFAIDYPERVSVLVFAAGAVGREGSSDVSEDETPEAQTGSGLGGLFNMASSLDPASPLARAAVRAFLTPERFVSILRDAYYVDSVVTETVEAGYQRPLQITGWEAGFLGVLGTENVPVDVDALSRSVAAAQIPVLLIWGVQDTWVPITVGESLRAALPDASWITYADVGHMPMEENVMQFNQDIVTFLRSVFEEGGS